LCVYIAWRSNGNLIFADKLLFFNSLIGCWGVLATETIIKTVIKGEKMSERSEAVRGGGLK
jgi:hypothetical protein